jgi:hypothetical protein
VGEASCDCHDELDDMLILFLSLLFHPLLLSTKVLALKYMKTMVVDAVVGGDNGDSTGCDADVVVAVAVAVDDYVHAYVHYRHRHRHRHRHYHHDHDCNTEKQVKFVVPK